MSAFCVETQDRTMVFAALKDDCVDWVEKLCHSSFRVRERSSTCFVHHVQGARGAYVVEVTSSVLPALAAKLTSATHGGKPDLCLYRSK